MKRFCLLVGFSACCLAYAQQPATTLGKTPSSGISVLRPEYAPSHTPSTDATAADSLGASRELKELIRLQTEAIRTLSIKVDSLDDRLRRIEGKLR